MGKTICPASFRIQEKRQAIRRILEPGSRKESDRLFDMAFFHTPAMVYAALPNTMDAILMSMIIETDKQIKAMKARLGIPEDIMETSPSRGANPRFTLDEAQAMQGRRVKALVAIGGVPQGTAGVVDGWFEVEPDRYSIVVLWDETSSTDGFSRREFDELLIEI